MLSAKVALEVGKYCGSCITGGTRTRSGIPGEEEVTPSFEGDILLAVCNMHGWPAFVRALDRPARCVVIGRHPEERLRSLYTYARSGGEWWFRNSGIMNHLDAAANVTDSLENFFWPEMGRPYLEQSHSYIQRNLEEGCLFLRYKDFAMNFNQTIVKMLSWWHILQDDIPPLVALLQGADFAQKSARELKDDPHHSESKFSETVLLEVKAWIASHPDVQRLVRAQLAEVPY